MVRTDKFDITYDAANELLRVTLRGNWELQTVRDYKAALKGFLDEIYSDNRPRGNALVLVDTREGGAQSQEVIAYYQQELGGGSFTPRRLATVVTSVLFKRQIERIGAENQQLFTDERAALYWLLSGKMRDGNP